MQWSPCESPVGGTQHTLVVKLKLVDMVVTVATVACHCYCLHHVLHWLSCAIMLLHVLLVVTGGMLYLLVVAAYIVPLGC